MILIVGGAFQGKEVAARNMARKMGRGDGGSVRVLEAEQCCLDALQQDPPDILLNVHELVRRLLDETLFHVQSADGSSGSVAEEETVQKELERVFRRAMSRNPRLIVTMDELGCGVVPMDYADRAYRETAGRIGCFLARQAREVYRVVCGVETQIKG